MKAIETWLPIFPGFYGTLFGELLEENYKKKKEIAIRCCEVFEDRFEKYINKIEFQNIRSPREYNFETDTINVEIKIKPIIIKKYMKRNESEWKDYIERNYTSYDGFISSHSNDADAFEWNIEDSIQDEHKLGVILEFIAEQDDYEYYEMYEDLNF